MMECEHCGKEMRKISDYYYDCEFCPTGFYIPDENGFIPANPYEPYGIVLGYVLPLPAGTNETTLTEPDPRLDDMLKDCETVIATRENEISERIFKAKRKDADSVVVEFWQAEHDALAKLRQQVQWYRKTGTMLDDEVK